MKCSPFFRISNFDLKILSIPSIARLAAKAYRIQVVLDKLVTSSAQLSKFWWQLLDEFCGGNAGRGRDTRDTQLEAWESSMLTAVSLL